MTTAAESRRYDLDWLRVLAFGLLIFYHTGMFYNSEGWHAKSLGASDFIDPFMWLSSPWRLSLLFLISGVALRFALDKAAKSGGLGAFTKQRFIRLFVPIVFGMVVIVTPQSYFEMMGTGEAQPGNLAFWGSYLSVDDYSIMVPTWNHLWYVVYLLVYTLLVIPFMPLIRKLAGALDQPWFEKLMGGGRVFVLPALIFVTYRFTTDTWFPRETHTLVGDWGAHARYFSYFVIGLLIAKNRSFWNVLARTWKIGAWGALVLAVSLSILWQNWGDWFGGIFWIENIVRAMRVWYAWVIIIAFLGAGQAYLNRPSKRLSYLTTAVFPYYILHQTLIILVGVYFTSLGLPVALEALLVIVGTFVACYVLYEYVIRRVPLLRPLFGVPMQSKPEPKPALQPAE
jgi:glucan biosynthesis protein C